MAISGAICMSVGQSPTTTTIPTAHSPPLSFFSIALGTAASRGQRLLPYQQSSLGWQGSTPHTASLLSMGLGQKWAVRSPQAMPGNLGTMLLVKGSVLAQHGLGGGHGLLPQNQSAMKYNSQASCRQK